MLRPLRQRSGGNEKRLSKWESVKAGGRLRYILMTGILGFALPTTLIGTLVNYWLGAPGPLWGQLGIKLLFVPAAGYVFGSMMWSWQEREYQRWRRDHDAGAAR